MTPKIPKEEKYKDISLAILIISIIIMVLLFVVEPSIIGMSAYNLINRTNADAAEEQIIEKEALARNISYGAAENSNAAEEEPEIKVIKGFAVQASDGKAVHALIRLKEQNKLLKEFDSQNAQEVEPGKYDIEVIPDKGPVKKIELFEVDINSSNDTAFIDIDDVPEDKVSESEFLEVYAIDPTKVNFTEAAVTAVAKGTLLYKCREWNFEQQICEGNWELFKTGLIPGQEYTFRLTPEDPGFAEILVIKALHLDGDRIIISDIYNEVKALDNAWSEQINEYEYVRVAFIQNLTSYNDISLYPRTLSGTPRIEVYEADGSDLIAEFAGLNDNEYNKVYLTNLQGSQNIFDLRILDGSVEFDHIIDPVTSDYTYTGVTQASGPHDAFGVDLDDWPPADGQRTITGNTNAVTELTDAQYIQVSSSDNSRYAVPDPGGFGGNPDEPFFWSEMNITQPESKIVQLGFLFEGYPGAAGTVSIYLYNDSANAWNAAALASAAFGTADQNLSGTVSSGAADYINASGTLIWGVFSAASSEVLNVDYVKVNVTADLQPPNITLNFPPDNYATSSTSISFNWTAVDDLDTSISCNLTIDGNVNASSIASPNGTPVNYTVSGFAEGVHFWNVTCIDDYQNFNTSETRTFKIDTTGPAWSNSKTSPAVAVYSPGASCQFNVTWTDTLSSVDDALIQHNFSGAFNNFTMNNISSEYYYDYSDLAAGSYAWQSFANDTLGNANSTNIFSYTVNKAATISSLTAAPSWTEIYGTQTTINCSADNNEVTVLLYRNGTPASIPDVQTLAAGNYLYVCNNSAAQNYTGNSTNNTLVINKAVAIVNLSLNGNENNLAVTYPAPVTAAFSTNILSAAMYRNGSNVSSENNTPVTLSAGYYNYTVINPGNQNYSLSSKTFFAAVQQNTSTCSLTINPASPQTYGTAINASCSCTNPEASANLYRNGSSINSENNQLVALAAGSYNYVCNVSSTQNYTAASNSTVYIINKAAHTVHLEINGTESDRSFVYPAQTNVTGYLEINQAAGSAQLLRNGSAAASGSPASEAAVLGAGLYNYTYFYPASQNYTAQSITRFLQINKSATALNLTISPALVVINNTQTNVSCFADNPEVNVNLYRNNTPVSNPDVQTLASGDYNYTCNTTGSQNYTAASESNILTVLAKNPSSCSLNIIPSSPSAYGTAITATCSCSNPEASANLYRNGTNVTNENNTAVVLAAGNYNYVCNVSETANYSSAVNSTTYTINKAASACSLNFNPASPQTYGTAVNASCSCTNPESAAMLHRNGSDVTAENNNAVVLAAGSYFFNCTASTSQNYSYAENTSTYTINKAPSEVNLLLNEIDNNITAYIGDAVNHTVQLITPAAGYVELYRNNNLILSGNAPITNISVYNNVSITNITAVYNATQNYTSSFETHFINATDNESPAILSTIIDPYDPALGNDVSLNAIATDNGVIDSMSANISLPNGTIITALLPANYTTALTGRHNVTFITNDTANNIAAEEDYFIVGDIPVIAQFNVMNANLTGILTNLTIYFTGTEKQIELLAFTGNAVDNNTNILYDLEFLALAGDITVRLNNVNLSLDDNKTLGIDKNNAAPEFLVTYGINSTYSFTNSVVTTSYAGTGYTNEDNLAVYKCDNWNFTARQCLSSWTQIAAVQDKAADTFNFTAASFSAFSIKQEIAPPAPPAGGGVRKPAACYEDWQCTKWSVCSTGGLQIRECTDTGTCQHGTRVETRACIFRGTCSDNIKNQDETDIDCGGSICLPCPEGKTCLTDNDCINKCSPETKICYKPSKPIVTESPSIKVLTLFEGVWRQITQNIKFLAALSITLILIIIIYADYIKGKIAKINILENVAKKKAYGKITTKEYIKNILMMHKKAVIELLTKYRKIYIKRITRNIKAVKKKR